jgi:PAS domain S-box-containing protein
MGTLPSASTPVGPPSDRSFPIAIENRLGPWSSLLFGAIVGGLVLANGAADRPDLHLILDITLCFLPGIIAAVLAVQGAQQDATIPRLLACGFGAAAVLHGLHALSVLPWVEHPAWGHLTPRFRPATWAPACLILPASVILALVPQAPRRPARFLALVSVLAVLLVGIYIDVPPYGPPGFLGITRPSLMLVPVLFVAAFALALSRRGDGPLSAALVAMCVPLIAGHTFILFSTSPHDTPAMVAHVGAIAAFLGFLFVSFQQGLAVMEQGKANERLVRQMNDDLEERVRERTARLEAATLMLVEENTERGRAEEAARAGEAQLRSFVEQAPASIAILDRDMRYLAASRRWVEEFGRGRADLVGLNHYELIPDIPEAWKEVHRRGLAGESLGSDDDAWEQADGTTIWLRWAVHPWTDHRGQIGGIMILTEDISEGKRAEAALLAERELLRTVFDLLPDYVYAKDREGRFLAANEACARHMGVASAEALLGRTDADFYSPELAAQFGADEVHVLAGRPLINKDEGVVRADGARRVILTTKVPLTDGQGRIRGLVGTGRDITEREQAERWLAAQYSVTRVLSESWSLAEAAPAVLRAICASLGGEFGALWEMDRGAQELRCTEAWSAPGLPETLEATTRSTAVAPDRDLPGRVWSAGQPISLAEVGADPEFSRAAAAAAAGLHGALAFPVLLRGEVTGVIEIVGVGMARPDGPLLAMLAALGSQIGQFIEHRQAEVLFVQSQKMEAVGQLAGGIAHDFNNLLGVILGYVDLARKDLPEGHKSLRRIAGIQHAAERAAALTRQILTFGRRESFAPRVVDLNQIVEETETMLRRLIGEDVRLVVVLGPELGRVRADRAQLEQVLVNLAVNARDAMAKGGRLVIETSNVSLDAESPRTQFELKPGPHVMLAVSDTGHGMDAEVRARVFEPFFTTKEKGKGTGLGLAVVYGIVRQSGGSISLYSEPGRGTTFKVYLPRVDAEPSAVAPPKGEVRGGTETILLVEDEDALRLVAAEVLRSAGYMVLEAKDLVAATLAAPEAATRIDLLVTDVVLPGGSGPEVAVQVKAHHPDAKVLLVSGYTDGLLNGEPDGHLAAPFLGKPFSIDELLRKVREVLDSPPPSA